MKNIIIASILTAVTFSIQASDIKINSKYSGISEKTEAFTDKRAPVREIQYGGFSNIYFKCDTITVNTASSYTSHDGFSFPADVAMKFDGEEIEKANGAKYSTYKYGSDMINDDRYYTFNLNPKIIQLMKISSSVNIGMKAKHHTEWDYKSMDLLGFTEAYDMMCN